VPTISEIMTREHRRCDELYAEAESAVADGSWDAADAHFARFRKAMERHLDREEQVLFPAFEERTGETGGPTAVMRGEHDEMRTLMEQMGQALSAQDADAFLGASETLLILVQQHNVKEEEMLYPMTDQVLEAERDEVIERMKAAGA